MCVLNFLIINRICCNNPHCIRTQEKYQECIKIFSGA